MNKTIVKFVLAGNKFMSEKHLRQPGFTYNACRPLTKNNGKKLRKQEIHNIFIRTNQSTS